MRPFLLHHSILLVLLSFFNSSLKIKKPKYRKDEKFPRCHLTLLGTLKTLSQKYAFLCVKSCLFQKKFFRHFQHFSLLLKEFVFLLFLFHRKFIYRFILLRFFVEVNEMFCLNFGIKVKSFVLLL